MIEGKGLGNKKINRVNLSLTNEYDSKLRRLSIACGMRHTELAGMMLEQSLDNPYFVDELQKEYCKHAAYRIIVIVNIVDGEKKVVYKLYDGRRED
jgi:hypothetical protein